MRRMACACRRFSREGHLIIKAIPLKPSYNKGELKRRGRIEAILTYAKSPISEPKCDESLAPADDFREKDILFYKTCSLKPSYDYGEFYSNVGRIEAILTYAKSPTSEPKCDESLAPGDGFREKDI